ncbi:hypothetical protein, partial [Pseudomonas sp. Sample_24]|uniref:hypothetical protein n=1 Tax=Pseudomonas sp. Sample_24 TaxID=2448268 RepID=UPI0019D5149D
HHAFITAVLSRRTDPDHHPDRLVNVIPSLSVLYRAIASHLAMAFVYVAIQRRPVRAPTLSALQGQANAAVYLLYTCAGLNFLL